MTIDDKNIRCTINYLEELKSHTSGYSVEWLDIAIEALKYYKFKEDFMNYMKNSHCGYDGDNPNRF